MYRWVEDGYVGVKELVKCSKVGLGLRWLFIGPFEVGDLKAPSRTVDRSRRRGPMLYKMDR